VLYFTCDVQSSIETLNFSDGSACPCGVAVLSDPSRKAMYDAALLRQQRFDDAAHGRDTVDELSDMVDKLEIKIVKSSSSSARTGRPASGRIDLFFTFTTAAAAPPPGTPDVQAPPRPRAAVPPSTGCYRVLSSGPGCGSTAKTSCSVAGPGGPPC